MPNVLCTDQNAILDLREARLADRAAVRFLRGCEADVELRQPRERSVGEAAQILGISTAEVKTPMFHARAALRRMRFLKNIGIPPASTEVIYME